MNEINVIFTNFLTNISYTKLVKMEKSLKSMEKKNCIVVLKIKNKNYEVFI